MNEAFIDYLKGFKVLPEVSNLYLSIMEDIFKTREGDREQEMTRLQKNVSELEVKLLKIDEMYITGDLENDSYRRLKTTTNGEIQRVQGSLVQLSTVDTNYMKYCRFNLTFLTHLPVFYEQASTAVRKKILGSIFTGKLIFENGNYRTTGLNEAIALIGQFQHEFGHKKAERLDISDKTFGNVPETGVEPATFALRMRENLT